MGNDTECEDEFDRIEEALDEQFCNWLEKDAEEQKNKKKETPKPVTYCKHEWIDVGFNHPKWVCKKCNQERKD